MVGSMEQHAVQGSLRGVEMHVTSSAMKAEPTDTSTYAAATAASIFPGSSARDRAKKFLACARSARVTPLFWRACPGNKGPWRPSGAIASRFGGDEFGIQGVGQPRYDLVLHVQGFGRGLVEAIGPHMASGLGVGQLRIQAKTVAAALHRAL